MYSRVFLSATVLHKMFPIVGENAQPITFGFRSKRRKWVKETTNASTSSWQMDNSGIVKS